MSPDMFTDATSSTPIPVFTPLNEETKNDSKNSLQNVTAEKDCTGSNLFQNELIKVDFDKQTVSARALYAFFAPTERFYPWCTRYFSFGLTANVDFTAAKFFLSVNNGAKQDIGDYLLTIDAAKHIAMVQRSEKGKQARQYFINIEKLYLKTISNKQTDEKSVSLLETLNSITVQFDNLNSSITLLKNEYSQQQQLQKKYDSLVEKTLVLEKQITQHHELQNLKGQYIEKIFIQKVDKALKETFTEVEKIIETDDFAESLSRIGNFRNTVTPTYKMLDMKSNHRKTTLEEDLIKQYYLPAHRKIENAVFLTGTEITQHLEKFNIRVTVTSVGIALRKLGFERVPHSKKGGKVKGYFVIQL